MLLSQIINPALLTPDHKDLMMKYASVLTMKGILEVPQNDVDKYQGDLYGLLQEHSIDPTDWFYTLFYNGYNSPMDYRDRTRLRIPNTELAISLITKETL